MPDPSVPLWLRVGPGVLESLLCFRGGSGFRLDQRLGEAAFLAIGHVAVDDPALGGLVEGGGQLDELGLGGVCIPAGQGRAEFFLLRFEAGDDTGVTFAADDAFACALCC